MTTIKENQTMSKILSLTLAILFTLVTACTPARDSANQLILGTHAAYPPYESVNDKGEIVGFDIDVAAAVAQKLGKKLVVKNMSFDALILALKQGKFDIIMGGISITPSRQKQIAFVPYQGEPVKVLSLLFWNKVPAELKYMNDLPKLGNGSIAVQAGTCMEDHLAKVKGVSAKALDGTIELIMDIKHGKSVAALVEPHIATSVVPLHSELKRVDIELPEEDWVLGNGIGVKLGNSKTLAEIESAVQVLKSEGVIQKLEAKWFKAGQT
jgi:arginine transport system substrate-binding protein